MSKRWFTLRIMGSQNWWFGDPRTLLYRVKPLYRRVQWFLGIVSKWFHISVKKKLNRHPGDTNPAARLLNLDFLSQKSRKMWDIMRIPRTNSFFSVRNWSPDRKKCKFEGDKFQQINMTNESAPGCLGYLGDYTTQLYRDYSTQLYYIGIIINHYKDPY